MVNITLSEEQKREYHDCFCLFEKNRGFIKQDQVRDCLRHVGFNPTDSLLQNLQWELDSSEQGRLGFKEFLELITRLLQEMDQAREGWSDLENSNQP